MKRIPISLTLVVEAGSRSPLTTRGIRKVMDQPYEVETIKRCVFSFQSYISLKRAFTFSVFSFFCLPPRVFNTYC